MLDIVAIHNAKQALKNCAWKSESINFKSDISKYRKLPEKDKEIIKFIKFN